ncbi:hypothetical protein BS17DRAFT_364598 [Gyrodon lividus]|nr:hypothetical protein BS17DRAFT_364598 [Gyrodon lividus]
MIPNSGFLMSSAIPTFCFELFLCVLAVGYCGAGVWEHYRSEKRWKVNELVKILARDSIIYFALILAAAALNIGNWQVSAPSSFMALSMSLQTFIPFYFSPRLVINVKQRNNRVHMSIIEHDLLVHNIPMGIHAQDGPPLG